MRLLFFVCWALKSLPDCAFWASTNFRGINLFHVLLTQKRNEVFLLGHFRLLVLLSSPQTGGNFRTSKGDLKNENKIF